MPAFKASLMLHCVDYRIPLVVHYLVDRRTLVDQAVEKWLKAVILLIARIMF